LNAVQPFDWAAFLNERLNSTSPHAPLGGIEHSSWKLTYDGVRSGFWKAEEGARETIDLSYSIGLKAKDDGTIADVQYGGPAQKAGVVPAVKLIAVNNRQFTPAVLREAVAKTASDAKPIELLVKTGDYYEVHRGDYQGGARDPSTPDLLTAIIKPHAQ
jgi:predicted metalloprotease with PDZ domain